MAYRKRRASKVRRPRRRRPSRRRPSRRRRSLTRFAGAFPTRLLVKLKYSQIGNLSFSGTAVLSTAQFRCNSIYDPDYTGGGHQPMGRDQYAGIYLRYRVVGMSYVVTFINQEAKSVDCFVIFKPNTAIDTTIENAYEGQHTRHRATLGYNSTDKGIRIFKGYISMAKANGVTRREVMADDEHQSLMGDNPIKNPIMTVAIANQTTNTACSVNVRVLLTYHTIVSDVTFLGQS